MTRQLVSIVPHAPVAGTPCMTQGTKVLLADGSELGGITKITLTADINDVWRAQIEVIPSMNAMAGVEAEIVGGEPSWWRRALCRMAGVQLRRTGMERTSTDARKP